MASRRYRANRSLGTKINSLDSKAQREAKSTRNPHLGVGAVQGENLAPEAATEETIAPEAVTGEKIKPGAVGTDQLGIITRILSDYTLELSAPHTVMLNAPGGVLINGALIGGGGDSVLPAGHIGMWPTATPPVNWLLCHGQAVSRTTYASLFAAIGTQYGVGNGTTTFNVPDFRERTPVGHMAGSAEFGTLGGAFGSKTHTLSVAQIPSHTHPDYQINYSVLRENGGTFVGGTTLPATRTGTTGLTGGGEAHNNIQPSRAVNFIIKASNGDTAGDSQLTQRVSALEVKQARVWEPAIPAAVAVNSSTASIDPVTGTVTVNAGCTAVRLDGVFQPGYEYEILLDLQIDSGHSTDNSAWMRMTENGVNNVLPAYNTAGAWAQYNGIWGVYSASGGTSGAIGAVSGAGLYVDYMCTIRLRPWASNGDSTRKAWFYTFESFTGGSARGVQAGGYTPSATSQFDGIVFMFNGLSTGKAQGRIRVYKRRLA